MDVDKLFKLPKLPQSSLNKRKWAEPNQDALKAAKVEDVDTTEDEPRAGPSRRIAIPSAATVQDVGDDEVEEDDEGEASKFAPGNDADYFVDEDDEGGRFFGGGLTDQQKRILEIMNRGTEGDDDDKPKPERELADLRKTLVKFERAINKNQEMRVRFADDASKFIESEADLDASLKSLLILTTNPALFYPETIKHGTPASLCGLLSHENVDIVASVIEVIEELTDDDVLDAGEEGREEAEVEDAEQGASSSRKGMQGMNMLVDSLLENSFIDLLIENLARFNDQRPPKSDSLSSQEDAAAASNAESDANAIFHLLGVIENLVSLRPSLAKQAGTGTKLLTWLMTRIKRKGAHDQNRGYAGELLAILLQSQAREEESSSMNRDICSKFGQMEGIDGLLAVLAVFRKRDPSADADETEFMENIFDALCAALTLPENKQRFYNGEGTELMCILMREKRIARLRAVKVLDHALSGPYGAPSAKRLVECQGLKTLFSVFMGRSSASGGHSEVEPTLADEEHALGILVSLLNHLASDSKERFRLLKKFVENDYEKVDRLLEIRRAALARLAVVEAEEKVRREEEGEDAEDDEAAREYFYFARLEGGLFMVQMTDYILAWICMEDDGILAHTKRMMGRREESLESVIEVLKEYYENVGDDAIVSDPSLEDSRPKVNGHKPSSEGEKDDGVLRLRDVIVQLVNYLLAVI